MDHWNHSFIDVVCSEIGLILLLGIVMLFLLRKWVGQGESRNQKDPITGGLNEDGLIKKAEYCLSRYKMQYAVVTMEVCNFRQLVQTFGMDKSKQTLKYLHQTLKVNLGKAEPLARVGSGTFCFLLRNRQESAIRTRLIRISEAVNQFNQNARISYRIVTRFGVYIPENTTESLEEMQLKITDVLASGEEQYVFYREQNKNSASYKWELIRQADQALRDGDFQVYMQPVVRLSDNRIVGAEAVIRWRHPQRGVLTPEMFIPVLEEYHQLTKYELCWFEQVCRWMSQLAEAGKAPCPISLNLTYESTCREDFLRSYVQTVKKYGISPELIEFELGKVHQEQDVKKIQNVVKAIHDHGFRCSLDGFGSSRVPLHLLRELDVDTVKLDHSLFSSENNNRRNRFVLEAIIKIANQMKIRTVAKGIDNISQIRYLQQSGCDMVQGFYYFQPFPMDECIHAVYHNDELRYVEEGNDSEKSVLPAKNTSSDSVVMFSLLTEKDCMIFSSAFSPALEGRLAITNAMSMLRHSELIHENDRMDFFHLLERCQKETGWVEDTIRCYTAQGRYEWLEVHLHKEHLLAGDAVISGTLVNMAGWKSEVNRWKEKANRDALTGLYNREYFEQSVNAILKKGIVTSAAIIFVDIDDFKQVNDTLGHMVGDDVICWVAKRVIGIFRHSDIVARYGGDEFVVFVNGIGKAELHKRLQQLCEGFRYPYRNDAIEYQVSGSIGAAMFPEDGTTYLELLDHADGAVYEAKRQGKNRFVFYEPGMEAAPE